MSKRLVSFGLVVLGLVLAISWAAAQVKELQRTVKDHGGRIDRLEARQ